MTNCGCDSQKNIFTERQLIYVSVTLFIPNANLRMQNLNQTSACASICQCYFKSSC